MLREPIVKHLDASEIFSDSKELNLFIAGLQKIITEEIGSQDEDFTAIVSNDIESENKNNIGALIAKQMNLRFVQIQDA